MEKPYRFSENTSSFAHYWAHGAGKHLLHKIGYTPDLKEAEKYIPYLFEWDNVGDQVIMDIFWQNGFKKSNASLLAFLNKDFVETAEKEVWNTFFSKVDLEPVWLNKEKLKIGAEFCRRAGLSALIVLRDYCLMGGYESAAINKPLIYTGALKKGAVKRLSDTVEFWVQVTKENGLQDGSEGMKQIFLTRMIHSYSRVNILKQTDWDTSKWGIPLNIWDMLATNLGFSLVFLEGLRRIGLNPSKEEIEGLFHFWKYIGTLLGIPSNLLPDSEAEAIHALYLWTMTQREADEDSRALALALKEEPIHSNYPKNPLYRKMMREVHVFYNYYFLGDYSCQKLDIPKTTIGRFGIVNIWRAKRQEEKIVNNITRQNAITEGSNEQERVREIYQEYNKQ